MIVATTALAAPPGAVISNQASLDYVDSAGQPSTVLSNTVDVVTAVVRSSSAIEFTRVLTAGAGIYQETVGPSSCFQGGAFALLADPVLTGGVTIDPTQTREVSVAPSYNLGEPLFLRLTDSDQNLDFLVIDTVVVTVTHAVSGDTETIQLSETGVNTGVFSGYVPSSNGAAVPGDCVLQGTLDSTVRVSYVDPADATDAAETTATLDPLSVVFESVTGIVVDGVQIELVDAATGLPAPVFGNDGVSTFPSSIVSGSTVVDSSGASYVFGTGEYRFPVVPSGDYRLVVTPPANFTAPSSVSIANLQLLPGAPYSLSPASFGAAFMQSGPFAFNWDIPVDPQSTGLFLQKRTLTTVAAPGDFVRYDLTLENNSLTGTASNIQVIDQLPAGTRFISGSVTINGAGAPDPIISPDLRTLEFNISALNVAERVTISYVVEIIGGTRNQELVNRATAIASGGLVSNEATALIRLTEDLFRSTGTIIGRVLEGDCSQETFAEEQGIANIRIYLEDGRYAVTDKGGRFHFEGLQPGTHVAQLDTFTVPDFYDVIGCDEDPDFAGRADSQFVRLSPGSLLRADFYLRRRLALEGRLELELRNVSTDSAERVAYYMTLNGIGNVAIRNIDAMILLPDGVNYVPGSMRIDGKNLGDPHMGRQVISMALPEHSGNWTSEVSFIASFDPQTSGELVTKAFAKFNTPIEIGQQTPVAETKMHREPAVAASEDYVLDLEFGDLSAQLSPEDQVLLDLLIEDWQDLTTIEISAVGHTDSRPIAARNRHVFADNYALSRARAMSAAFYIADALGIPDHNIQIEGHGADDPVTSDASAAGRQQNRRVQMMMSGLRPSRPSFVEVTQESSGTKITRTMGAEPGMDVVQDEPGELFDVEGGLPSSQVEPDIDSLAPGIAMLLPEATFEPAIPTTKLSIQHEPQQSVRVTVNGHPVSMLNFDAMGVNGARTVAVSRWRGVNLDDGENVIRAVILNADGSLAKTITRNIYYSGPAIRGEFVSDMSTLVADGKTRPIVAVRLYDRAGRPSRQGTIGAYRVDAPYRSRWEVENDRKNDLVTVGSREPVYRVGPGGVAFIELEPTTQTGEVTLNLKFDHRREQAVRAWLRPAPRDWILVGFAEGTAGYNTLSDNAIAAAAAGFEDGYYEDGRIAFFAKGQIAGEYLLTLAYDSARDRTESRNRFETVVDPNAFYSLYADTSEQRFEAPSQRKLFVKLERQQFYALFGDFETGLSVADLARYDRRFNGLKSEYRGDNVGYTVFAAETNQAFNRDEIRGDGTSGLYQLSRAPIIANSEQVRIEVRDRFDSGQVVSSQTLSRFLDYNLDTLNGTLFFKKPVLSRDLNFNPVFIVVEYESASTNSEDVVAGGRGSLRFANDTAEIGVTHINDGSAGAEADLTGVDFRWQINPQTLLKAEYAETSNTVAGVEQNAAAHSIELEHNGENVDVRAYIREVDDQFGLGHQSAADRGVRRLGVDARGKISERLFIEGEAAWQQNLETDAIRNLARVQLRYERESFTSTVGIAHAEDKFADGDIRSSDLAELGLARKFLAGKLRLRVSGSTELSGTAASTDFPTRFVIGADYRIRDGIELISEYEEARGRDIDVSMSRVGIRATPWSRAQINTSLTNEITEYGPRLFANVGLVQGFQLSDHWSLDIGLDQTNTLAEPDPRQFDADRELVSGSLNEDFLAIYTGAMYSSDAWSANTRVEYRNSDSEERTSLLFGWYRQPQSGHGLSAALTMFSSEDISGDEMTAADLKFGWAYRLAGGKWSFLDRVDLIYEHVLASTIEQNSWRLINNFNANLRISAATQLSLQYAFKYVRNEFDGVGYNGYTDLVGFDLRRGIRGRWDVGANTSVYHSYRSKIIDYGFGVDVGYNIGRDMWLTLGYNIAGFHDSDFAQARYTAQGPYLRFAIKANQRLLKDIAGQR
ncbi:MAG: OmpA family protein [Proteobacteria bacterium]|nr:OmpA family protein [Pseudomonadota bacterium]